MVQSELNGIINYTGITVAADDGVLLVTIPEERKKYKRTILKYIDKFKELHKCTRHEIFIKDVPVTTNYKHTNFDYKIITNQEDYLYSLSLMKDEIAIDFETSSLDARTCDIYSCGFSDGERTIYVPCVTPDGKDQVSVEALMYGIKNLVKDGKKIIVHNAKYEFRIFDRFGIKLKTENFIDTMICSHINNSEMRKGLKYLVKEFFHIKMTDYDDVTGTGKKRVDFKDVPLEQAAEYCSADAYYTHKLWKYFEKQFSSADLKMMLHENKIMEIAIGMEDEGILLDVKKLNDLKKEADETLVEIEKEVWEVVGREINIASPKQLGELLFDELELDDNPKKTKTGYCTDFDVLTGLKKKHPDNKLIDLIFRNRSLAKLSGTYYTLPEKVNPSTGRVHATLDSLGTVSGRFSSSGPNLQNIPPGDVRRSIIAKPGWSIMTFDYSQVELRVLAHVIQSETLIQAFKDGVDPHTLTAAKMFGKDINEISKDSFERKAGKTLNFALIYMQGPSSTADQLGITIEEAKVFIDKYFEAYPDVKPFIDKYIEKCKKRCFSDTLDGRKRILPKINSKNYKDRTKSEREAWNMKIQGTAAAIIRYAMIDVARYLETTETCKLLVQVHDELVFMVKDEDIEFHKEIILQIMKDPNLPFKFDVPLDVDVGVAKNYGDAK